MALPSAPIAGVAQDLARRGDHERQVRRAGLVRRHEIARRRIEGGIGNLVRLAGASQEGLQAHHVRRIRIADDQRPAVARLQEAHPAQDQRAGDPLAEVGLGDQQRPQPLGWDQNRLYRPLGMAVHQRRPRRELADLGQKMAGPMLDHRLAPPQSVALGDRDLPRQKHEHPRRGLARLEQRLAVRIGDRLTESPQPIDLGRCQDREGLLRPRMQHRPGRRFGGRVAHGQSPTRCAERMNAARQVGHLPEVDKPIGCSARLRTCLPISGAAF